MVIYRSLLLYIGVVAGLAGPPFAGPIISLAIKKLKMLYFQQLPWSSTHTLHNSDSKLVSHSTIHPISRDCNHGNVMGGF